MSSNKIEIEVNADWSLLAQQKLALVEAVSVLEYHYPTLVDPVQGIINLLDDIQDKAAEQLGEEVVFPHLGKEL